MGNDLAALLADHGVDLRHAPVRLLRHADQRHPDLFHYIGTHALTVYQAVQDRAMPKGTVLVAFFGNRSRHGLLLGAWRVDDCIPTEQARREGLLEDSFEAVEDLGPFFHRLIELPDFDDLRLRLEVEWGHELAWRRVLKAGDRYPCRLVDGCPVLFMGLASVSLVMSELKMVLTDVTWLNELGSVAGIYVIKDEHSGQHYVGSASGQLGILGRWKHYAATGHGDNEQLVALVKAHPGRQNDFRFTLLETFPLSTPVEAAVARENYWKLALCTRTHGLNSN